MPENAIHNSNILWISEGPSLDAAIYGILLMKPSVLLKVLG